MKALRCVRSADGALVRLLTQTPLEARIQRELVGVSARLDECCDSLHSLRAALRKAQREATIDCRSSDGNQL